MVHRAYIGLGSNLDGPERQVRRGIAALRGLPQVESLRASALYRTAPWGRLDQPPFINAVVEIETEMAPRTLLEALLDAERAAGRRRDGTLWGPRVLDLDVLLYGDACIDEPGLHLPHPRLHERAFVLLPLADLAPGLLVPGHGRVERLLSGVDCSGCERLAADPA